MVLIPFAYKSNGQTLVDIGDVPSGKACDCICPSCHCPLIARHCTEDREDHFAHDPAFKLHQDYIECDFSIHVAIRLMLKQLLAASHTLKLPNYIVQEPSSAENITVTKGKTLDFDRITIEVKGFDAVIDIAGYQLAIFISYYPGRMVAPGPSGNIKGIIQLDITEVEFKKLKALSLTRTGYLNALIVELSAAKTWIWHVNRDQKLATCKHQYIEYMQARNENHRDRDASKYYSCMYQDTAMDIRIKPAVRPNVSITVYRCYNCARDYPESYKATPCPVCHRLLWETHKLVQRP